MSYQSVLGLMLILSSISCSNQSHSKVKSTEEEDVKVVQNFNWPALYRGHMASAKGQSSFPVKVIIVESAADGDQIEQINPVLAGLGIPSITPAQSAGLSLGDFVACAFRSKCLVLNHRGTASDEVSQLQNALSSLTYDGHWDDVYKAGSTPLSSLMDLGLETAASLQTWGKNVGSEHQSPDVFCNISPAELAAVSGCDEIGDLSLYIGTSGRRVFLFYTVESRSRVLSDQLVEDINNFDWQKYYNEMMPGVSGYDAFPIKIVVSKRGAGNDKDEVSAAARALGLDAPDLARQTAAEFMTCDLYEDCLNGYGPIPEQIKPVREGLWALIGPETPMFRHKMVPLTKLVKWGYESTDEIKRFGKRHIEGDWHCVLETHELPTSSGCYEIGWLTAYGFATPKYVVTIVSLYGHQ